MARPADFEFSRSRGVVWVCDVAGSSSRLNSENGVEDTEAFLPRLYWTAVLAVESAGGKFIKWTGTDSWRGLRRLFIATLGERCAGVSKPCGI